MDLILRPWRHYVDFSGRSRRSEYWLFFLVWYGVMCLAVVPIGLSDAFAADFTERSGGARGWAIVLIMLFGLWVMAGIIPSWSVSIRRLHDQDKTGWMILLTLIPYLGFLFVLVIALWPGTPGENDYGPDPREEGQPDTDEIERVFS